MSATPQNLVTDGSPRDGSDLSPRDGANLSPRDGANMSPRDGANGPVVGAPPALAVEQPAVVPNRTRIELLAQVSRLEAENAELRSSLLRWRVAAVAKWADTASQAMETAREVKELKRQLHESELDRLDIGERHHQLNQLHHQLNERYLKMSRRYGNISRLSDVTGAGLKRRIVRVVSPLSK